MVKKNPVCSIFVLVALFFPLRTTCKNVDIDEILDTLGLEGQYGQMAQIDIATLLSDDATHLKQGLLDHYIGELGVGSVLNNVAKGEKIWTISDFRKAAIQIQETAKKFNRPPVIWGLDSVHGANYLYNTITTPQPLNLAASFNTSLSYQAGKWASIDTRRAGISWLFSPLLGLSWKPNWSRVYETFGEDPVLVAKMAKAMIEGIQEKDNDNSTLIPSQAAACAKHWVGYSMPHNGHDRAPSWIPIRHLYQYFLPPWKYVIDQVDTVMESYTEIDGVPNVANQFTLNHVLRQELGFEGMVVSDYHEIFNLFEWHHTASNRTNALKKAIEEGSVDMSMIANEPDDYFNAMESFDQNVGYQARIRTSAERILKLKQKLNMFDEAFRMDEYSENVTDSVGPSDDDIKAAIDMTVQSIILAENKNDILPLDLLEPYKVLVTGPTSNSLAYQSGGWTWQWQGVEAGREKEWFSSYGNTVLEAIQEEALYGNWQVSYSCGVDILGNSCDLEDIDETQGTTGGDILDTIKGWVGKGDGGSNESIKRAMNLAKDMDVIIVCIGEENYAEKPGDIRSLLLPPGQYDLIAGLRHAAPHAQIVTVYFGGRPRLLLDVVEQTDAVLLGFLPGPLGTAISNLLTGRANPSAKLPITYPKFEDGGGIPYMHSVSDMCTKDTDGPLPHWENSQCEVQWHFGHGKSYTIFAFESLSISSDSLNFERNAKSDPSFTVKVTVKNVGRMPGAETVLFFTFDEMRSTTPEYKRLRGFEKIWLEPGDSKEVNLTLSLNDLRFIGPDNDSHYILQDGMRFRVGVGAHTDCRVDPSDQYCSPPITIHTDPKYIGSCEAACNLWQSSGCAGHEKMTIDSCWDMCYTDYLGWGWNYVECMEAIVLNESFQKGECWKLTTFCRDVTTLGKRSGNPSPLVLSLALVSGLLASLLVYFHMRSGYSKASEGEFGDVQFSQVRNTDHELMLT